MHSRHIGSVVLMMATAFSLNGFAQELSRPSVEKIDETADTHAFLAAARQQEPLDLADFNYMEEEYLVSGRAGVYDWPGDAGLEPLAHGSYVTRILVRRPAQDEDFSGVTIVEGLNPSSPVDLPIMWAESYQQFMEDGVAWVGVTVKPNTIKSLKAFSEERYGRLGMPHPEGGPTCDADAIGFPAQPTTADDETGLAWDMLTQIGLLLKNTGPDNPLSRPAEHMYMTGQSQTAGYARTYATVFALPLEEALGRPLYDGYLYSGSPPWQVPLHQCAAPLPEGDPRLLTGLAGVPVIEIFAQGDVGTNITTRRQDSDTTPDLYRRYEVAGAAHTDPWEQRSFPSEEDMLKAAGQSNAIAEANCEPGDVTPSDFPIRYIFNAAWRHLDTWVREDVSPSHAPRLELKEEAAEDFHPATSFVTDEHGNARGGIRTPYVEVPTARWVGARTPALQCQFQGYKIPFSDEELNRLYADHDDYVSRVQSNVGKLVAEGWLTRSDGAEIIEEAGRASFP